MSASMRDFARNFEDFREKYGPRILSITLHLIFILLLILSNEVRSRDSESPRYIEIQIGSPIGMSDSSFDETPEAPAPIFFSQEEAEEVQEILDQMLPELPESEVEEGELPPNVTEKVQELPPQKPQIKKQKFEIKVTDTQEAQVEQKQRKGEEKGNSDKGQDSATYLEWLQLTVQEMSEIPFKARAEKMRGNAVLRLTFNRDGYVREYRLMRPTGTKLLDAAALRVARKLMNEPFPPMPTDFEQGKRLVTYDFPISFKP